MLGAAAAAKYPPPKKMKYDSNKIHKFYKKKLGHQYPVTQLSKFLWQPGDPPAADPWLSVSRLLGVWRFMSKFFWL
jgi:hypothetical protein